MSMMRFYLYRQQIIIPTVAETEAGFYLDSEPVTICDVSAPELPACLLTQLVGQNPRELG